MRRSQQIIKLRIAERHFNKIRKCIRWIAFSNRFPINRQRFLIGTQSILARSPLRPSLAQECNTLNSIDFRRTCLVFVISCKKNDLFLIVIDVTHQNLIYLYVCKPKIANIMSLTLCFILHKLFDFSSVTKIAWNTS